MYRVLKPCKLAVPSRFASAQAVPKGQDGKLIVETCEDGLKLAALPDPNLGKNVTRLALVFKSGSKRENIPGVSHLLRRSFGCSTHNYTSVNLTRHLEQMGAKVNVTGTREHLVYTVDCSPNLASRAGYIVAQMASDNAYYEWELNDVIYPLMSHDVEMHNRLNYGALCADLLHEAAFGKSLCGTGLGNSIVAPKEQIGSYAFDDIKAFHNKTFTPGNCTIALVDAGMGSAQADSMETLNEIRSGLLLNSPETNPATSQTHDFISGEVRRDLSNAPTTHVMVAGYVPIPEKSDAVTVSLAIAARAIDGVQGSGQVKYAATDAGPSVLARTAGAEGHPEHITSASSLFQMYDRYGLFGFNVSGSCGKAASARTKACYAAMSKLGKSGLTSEELEKGKALLCMQVMSEGEAVATAATDLALQVNQHGSYMSQEDVCKLINSLSLDDVNKTLASVMSTGKVAMSAVGKGLRHLPPLKAL